MNYKLFYMLYITHSNAEAAAEAAAAALAAEDENVWYKHYYETVLDGITDFYEASQEADRRLDLERED